MREWCLLVYQQTPVHIAFLYSQRVLGGSSSLWVAPFPVQANLNQINIHSLTPAWFEWNSRARISSVESPAVTWWLFPQQVSLLNTVGLLGSHRAFWGWSLVRSEKRAVSFPPLSQLFPIWWGQQLVPSWCSNHPACLPGSTESWSVASRTEPKLTFSLYQVITAGIVFHYSQW